MWSSSAANRLIERRVTVALISRVNAETKDRIRRSYSLVPEASNLGPKKRGVRQPRR
jgi:hypothetical protein